MRNRHKIRHGMATIGLAATLCVSGTNTALAGETDLQEWTTFKISLPPTGSKWSYGVWSQIRFNDDISHFNQFLINPSAHYKLKDGWKVGFGYQYFYKNGKPDEQMPWQEFSVATKFSNGFVLGNRVRLEERFIDEVSGVTFRLRYRINGSYPLGDSGRYLTGSESVWMNLNEQSGGPAEGFDQNRLFGGMGWHVGKRLRIEAGYQWRYKANHDSDHVIMLQFFYDTKGKSVTEPVVGDAHH